MFGHYCYGIQGPTVLFMCNQNLHNLQNDAETTTTDYAKVHCKYYTEQSLDILAPTLTPITFMSTSANKIFASSADSSGSWPYYYYI